MENITPKPMNVSTTIIEEGVMKHIVFRYKINMSGWKWRTQECFVSSVRECIRIYGLDEGDVEYEIVSFEEV